MRENLTRTQVVRVSSTEWDQHRERYRDRDAFATARGADPRIDLLCHDLEHTWKRAPVSLDTTSEKF
jgi:hypothetical protein